MRMEPISEPVALPERKTMTAAVREDLHAEQMASIRRSIRIVWNAAEGGAMMVPWVGKGFVGNRAALCGDNISRLLN